MQLFIATVHEQYESDELIGVFETREKANDAIANYTRPYDHSIITPVKLGTAYTHDEIMNLQEWDGGN